MVPETAGAGRPELEHMLLHHPDLPAFLAAAPQAARLLRPICRLLQVDLPPILQLPPRPKPAPRPKAARPDPAAGAAPGPDQASRAEELRLLFPGYRLTLKGCR